MSNQNKTLVITMLIVVFGNLGAGILLDYIFNDLSILAKVISSLIGVLLGYLYFSNSKRYPQIKKSLLTEDRDERAIMIRQKAGINTYLTMMAVLFVLSGYFYLTESYELLFVLGGTYILFLVIYLIQVMYLKRNL